MPAWDANDDDFDSLSEVINVLMVQAKTLIIPVID